MRWPAKAAGPDREQPELWPGVPYRQGDQLHDAQLAQADAVAWLESTTPTPIRRTNPPGRAST